VDTETRIGSAKGIGRLLLRDEAASARLAGWLQRSGLRPLAWAIAHSGDSVLWFLAGLAAFFLGSGEVRRAGAMVAVLVPVLAVLAFGLKALFRRARPPGERGTLYVHFDVHAFPSSHAVRMGGLAAALALLAPPWATGMLVLWAVLVSLARVGLGIHYLLDVGAGLVLGAVLGGLLGQVVLRLV
jgi:undecaprenyl-diphosphatase